MNQNVEKLKFRLNRASQLRNGQLPPLNMTKIIFSEGMFNRIKLFVKSTRFASFIAFTVGYWQVLRYARKAKDDEVLRLAGAGSLVTHTCELTFYLVDTVNSRSKVH